MSARAARLQELQCVLCSEILREAVMMPCCAACCCHSCARTNLAHSGRCSLCGEESAAEDLIPCRMLREQVARMHRAAAENNNARRKQVEIPRGTSPPPSPVQNTDPNPGSASSNRQKSPSLSSISSASPIVGLGRESPSARNSSRPAKPSPSFAMSPKTEIDSNYSSSNISSYSNLSRLRPVNNQNPKIMSTMTRRHPSHHRPPHPDPGQFTLAASVRRWKMRNQEVPADISRQRPPPPPTHHRPRLDPQHDTLAQFEEAMRNLEARKRARKMMQTKLRAVNSGCELDRKLKEHESMVANFETRIAENLLGKTVMDKNSSPPVESNVKEKIDDHCNVDADDKNEQRNYSSIETTGEKLICEEEGVKNSKHLFCSGQILQDPVAVAELKSKTTLFSKEDFSETNALKRALKNMNDYDEVRLRKMREKLDDSDEDVKDKKKKKKVKEKKHKKDKDKLTKKKLRKLLKTNSGLKRDLEKFYNYELKKEEEKKNVHNSSSDAERRTETRRQVFHHEGNVQISLFVDAKAKETIRHGENSRGHRGKSHESEQTDVTKVGSGSSNHDPYPLRPRRYSPHDQKLDSRSQHYKYKPPRESWSRSSYY